MHITAKKYVVNVIIVRMRMIMITNTVANYCKSVHVLGIQIKL